MITRNRLHNSSAYGFTLIELLVSVAIIAILIGAVVINIDFRNVGKTIRDTANRTAMLMQLASDQAVYGRLQFGIRFHPASYEFYLLTENDKGESVWEIYEDDQLRFKNNDVATEFEVEISGLPIILETLEDELNDATDEDPIKPHVIFLSNGEMIPDFRIVISDESQEFRYEIAMGDLLPIVVEPLRSF